MLTYKIKKFPKSRIATIDVCSVGQRKNHIASFIEIDVSKSREKIKKYKKENNRISFTAWLLKTISLTIKDHEIVAGFLKGKNRVVIFDDINISIVIEKEVNGQKVPIPLLIIKVNECSLETITQKINDAKEEVITDKDIVLQKQTNRIEQIYYFLPGIIRRYIWKLMLKRPHLAFSKMGNVAFTYPGMIGGINGWFVPISVHPICFGINSIVKKAVVVNDKIEIREILNLSVLMDHDIVDGAIMARFIRDLSKNIEDGIQL